MKKQTRIRLITDRGWSQVLARDGTAGRIMSVDSAGKAVRRARSGRVPFRFPFKFSLELSVFLWENIVILFGFLF